MAHDSDLAELAGGPGPCCAGTRYPRREDKGEVAVETIWKRHHSSRGLPGKASRRTVSKTRQLHAAPQHRAEASRRGGGQFLPIGLRLQSVLQGQGTEARRVGLPEEERGRSLGVCLHLIILSTGKLTPRSAPLNPSRHFELFPYGWKSSIFILIFF